MCGIAGLLDPRRPAGMRELAGGMAATLAHRGPDAAGAWSDPAAGIAFGHRRLAILDLSPDGAQPMVTEGRGAICFNGEIYNHGELRTGLAAAGWTFRSRSDTEVLLAACLTWGVEAALPRLRGMFAFAFWDAAAQALWLARDRMGEKPLYWGRVGGTYAFASELRGLRTLPGWDGGVDDVALAHLLSTGCIPTPLTIHPGIAQLQPGCWLRFAADGTQTGPTAWWSLAAVARDGLAHPFSGQDEEAIERLDALLLDAVRGQMAADVPLGAFLSGGVDSSAIVAAMQTQSSQPVHTCTIAFGDEAFDESAAARRIAAHLGTRHCEFRVDAADALALVPSLVRIWDEPFADSSQLPTALVCRLARGQVAVALSGDGGDELFAGYVRHLRGPGLWRQMRRIPRPLRRLMAGSIRAWPGAATAALRLAGVREAQLRNKAITLAACLDADGARGLYQALTGTWRGPQPAAAPQPVPGPDGIADLRRQLQFWDQQGYLAHDILVKLDRAAMAVGLETRAPLLDERIVAFAWSLPDRLLVRGGVGKQVLRRVATRRLPPGLLNRPKQGFAVPLAAWLRGPLRGWAEDLLAPDRLAGQAFDAAVVRRAWLRFIAGRDGQEQGLWAVLMFQAWRAEHRP
jgi:asparagine synthase (glutamine-hydrolysing)